MCLQTDEEAYDAETRRCPDHDPNGDCTPGITASRTTLRRCGGAEAPCAYPPLRRAACTIVSGVSEELTRLAQLLALLESEIKPMMCATTCLAAP